MENKDYYWENGFIVFTEAYHLARGFCCQNGCRHCPYGFDKGGKQKVTISWSGGKDSAFALYKIIASKTFDVVSLHTVIDEKTKRVGLHGVHEALIEKQAHALGIPLKKIYLPASADGAAYKDCMEKFYDLCVRENIEGVVFGDIFLEDLREFRISLLQSSKLFAAFPLWGIESRLILKEFIQRGFKTTICAADATLFSELEVGKIIDDNFLNTLPTNIDPCGENGEFHTFVHDGPLFSTPVTISKGRVVRKGYSFQKKRPDGEMENVEKSFWFQDLLV